MNVATFTSVLGTRLKAVPEAQANPQALQIAAVLHEEEMKKARLQSGDLASAREAVGVLIDAWEAVGGDAPPGADAIEISATGCSRMRQAIEMARTMIR